MALKYRQLIGIRVAILFSAVTQTDEALLWTDLRLLHLWFQTDRSHHLVQMETSDIVGHMLHSGRTTVCGTLVGVRDVTALLLMNVNALLSRLRLWS